MQPSLIDSPKQNRILGGLPPGEYARLVDDLELTPVSLGQVIYEPGSTMTHVYFPTTCIVSLVLATESGSCAELAMTGHDGLVGISLVLGGETTNHRIVVQSAGNTYRIRAEIVRWELEQMGSLQRISLRYAQALLTQMAQSVVCNRHHSVDMQLCRWLLMSLDRLPGNTLNMTQELIANMLGVRREAVTEAAGKLQTAGLIQYSRGHIKVMDRPGLELRVCECYGAVKGELDRLYAPAPASTARLVVRPDPATLRQRAEERLLQTHDVASDLPADAMRLLHELQVHQVELEMHNEELRNAYEEADTIREKYADIYDFAPIGYFTLDAGGVIVDLNLAGAIMLGIKRSEKTRHRFAAFVAQEELPAFNAFVAGVLASGKKGICELSLPPIERRPLVVVKIEAVPDEDGRECRMVVIDITAERQAEKAIQERKQYLHALLDNFPFMVWMKDDLGRFLAVNTPFARHYGWPSADSLLGRTDFDLISPELAEASRAEDEAILHDGQSRSGEELVQVDGQQRWFETYKSPIYIDGHSVGTVGFSRDITQRHEMMLALEESEQRYRSFVENLPLGVTIIQDKVLRYINPRITELSGHGADDCVDNSFLPFVYPADHPVALSAYEKGLQGTQGKGLPPSYDIRIINKAGLVIQCRLHVSTVSWRAKPAVLGILEDVTEYKRMEDELRALASTDVLTELANLKHFVDHLGAAISRLNRGLDDRGVLLVIDIDHFKAINDSLGHAAGDAALRLFSALLREELRQMDTAGRIGGEKFAVLLPGADLATASVFAERLRKKAAETSVTMHKKRVTMTVSMGISAISGADASAEQVLARADKALYRAKTGGRNRIEFATETEAAPIG